MNLTALIKQTISITNLVSRENPVNVGPNCLETADTIGVPQRVIDTIYFGTAKP